MSNAFKLKPGRNLKILIGRAAAEMQPGAVHLATVRHDDWCPGLKAQSMLRCRCHPVIEIDRV